MKRVGIFGWSSSLSHAGRMVQIARQLSRSFEVVLFGVPKYLESSLLVKPNEFELIFHDENDIRKVLFEPISQKKEWLSFLSFLYEDINKIQNNQFDIVISDHRKTTLLAAQAVKIPSISISQTLLLGSYSNSVIDFSAIYENTDIAEGHITLSEQRIVNKKLDKEKLNALMKLNITNRIFERDLFLGDITLVLDDGRILPLSEETPSSVLQLPPILFDTMINIRSQIRKTNLNLKTILISRGGSGHNFTFENIVHFLAKRKDVQIILLGFSHGKFRDKENVLVLRYGPLQELMSRCDLFICNGGSISLYHALNLGINTCILPTHLEQLVNGLMFEKYDRIFTLLNPKDDQKNYEKLSNLIENMEPHLRPYRQKRDYIESQQQTLNYINHIVDKCP